MGFFLIVKGVCCFTFAEPYFWNCSAFIAKQKEFLSRMCFWLEALSQMHFSDANVLTTFASKLTIEHCPVFPYAVELYLYACQTGPYSSDTRASEPLIHKTPCIYIYIYIYIQTPLQHRRDRACSRSGHDRASSSLPWSHIWALDGSPLLSLLAMTWSVVMWVRCV